MQRYRFHKMHGLGNDFVVIDARQQPFTLGTEQLARWADRHTGIGCDQWLIIEPPHHPDSGASYRVFNADGSSAEQCLNGLRCIAWYLYQYDRADSTLPYRDNASQTDRSSTFKLDSPGGEVRVEVQDQPPPDATQGQVRVHLATPRFGRDAVGWQGIADDEQIVINLPAAQLQATAVNMGNPHAVVFVTEARPARARYGAGVCTHEQFSAGCNVGFAQIENKHALFLTVFERGSGPTHACGSGAAAAAVAAIQRGLAETPLTVRQPGGSVMIDWHGNDQPVLLSGPAEYVFSGEFVDDTSG